VQAVQNFKNAAHYDLKTVKIVMPDGTAHSVVKSAKRVIDAMEEFYADFGESVHDCLAFQRRKFDEPETRYAWIIREKFGQGFVARGLQLARLRQREYVGE
jgi:glutamate--cysteine ligase